MTAYEVVYRIVTSLFIIVALAITLKITASDLLGLIRAIRTKNSDEENQCQEAEIRD